MLRRGLVAASLILIAFPAGAQLHSVPFVSGLSSPVEMVQDPNHADTQYVVEKAGVIRVVQNGNLQSGSFLDIHTLVGTDSERGLLGLAFAPDYATSGSAYVYYTDTSGTIQIKRYTRSISNPFSLDSGSSFSILSQAHPNFSNHNGGNLRFGPDGYLYAGLGDGGSANDPNGNAQNPNTLLGKMIRIDPSHDDFGTDADRNYAIPSTNPFANGNGPISAMGEIWAFGYRNPWRFSFDDPAHGGNGGLIVGDVGQDAWEEVDYEPAGKGGRNYGWRIREGANDTGLGGTTAYQPLTDPIYQYAHNGVGMAITGGYVYRGTALGSQYAGRYFFGDEVTGKIWSLNLAYNGNGEATASNLLDHTVELGATAIGNPASIDVDSNGELYIVNYTGGSISRIAAVPEPASLIVLGLGTLFAMRRKAQKKC